ncbi:hypothetical protein FSC17_15395 (plasmid) [Acinetobacter indicus]|nr:hypothetical protein FSC17_15395 [Acinetobacter indicus]
MPKLKEILQGIAFLFVGIPIMIIASIMDQRAFKKSVSIGRKPKSEANDCAVKFINPASNC